MRKCGAVALAAMMLGMLAGCSKGDMGTAADSVQTTRLFESNPQKETQEVAGNATIKFRYWADNTEYSQLMQDIIAKFNAENAQGITVVGEEQPWDGGAYSENLFNAKMGGGDIDVAAWKLTSTPLFVNNNLLADLTDYVKNWDKKDDIDENIYNVMKYAGGSDKLYVMPWNIQVLYVYYRPSYFEKAGIEVPKTYEEFLKAAEKCTMDTDGDGKTDIYGFGMRGAKGGQEPWGSFIFGQGGNFEDMTTAQAVAGMQDFIELYQKGYCPPTAPSDGYNEIMTNFKNGKTAMTIHHTGSAKDMEASLGEDVSAFPFPAGKGQWTSMGDTETVIFESCQNKAAAFEWVSYLAAGEGQKLWCEGTGNVPVSKSLAQTEFFQNNRFMKASIDSERYAGILPVRDTTTEWISTIWPQTVSEALANQLSAKECMDVLQTELYK